MNELIKYLYSLGVKEIKIESLHGDTVFYFTLYDVGFSPIISNNLTVEQFKERLKTQYKENLKRQLEYYELEVKTLKHKLLIDF